MDRSQLIEAIFSDAHCLMKKMKMKLSKSSKKTGITHSQWFVLGIIKHCQTSNVKDISKQLGISPSATTQLIDGLVENGYVIRKADPKDRRSVTLDISAKGKKRMMSMKKERLEKMEKLFAPLSDAELETYLKLNKKIASEASPCQT